MSASGFTLVELLVVVSMMALLVALLLPSLQRARDQAVTTTCLSNQRQSYAALLTYAADHGEFPTLDSWEGLTRDQVIDHVSGGPDDAPFYSTHPRHSAGDASSATIPKLVDGGYVGDGAVMHCATAEPDQSESYVQRVNDRGQRPFIAYTQHVNVHETSNAEFFIMYSWSNIHGSRGNHHHNWGLIRKSFGWAPGEENVGARNIDLDRAVLLTCVTLWRDLGDSRLTTGYFREPHARRPWYRDNFGWRHTWPNEGIMRIMTSCSGRSKVVTTPPGNRDDYANYTRHGIP
jgi:prepilin-type N-terminal cleavage/methylation domain-containing protein